MKSSKSQCAAFALLAVILAFGWQALTVYFNYGGNWTALFCTGGKLNVPPQLESEGIYRFPNATGYDGQFYHYMAHDPFLQRGFAQYQDAARLRYRRPLVPVAAYLLAFGQDRFVDTALFTVIWLTVFFGTYWSARWAAAEGWHPAWGLAFLLVPATIVAIDRTIVDATLTALVIGLLVYARQGSDWKIYVILVCAALTRETGWLLAAGYCLYVLYERRWIRAAVFASSVLPSLVWTTWIGGQTRGDIFTGQRMSRSIWWIFLRPRARVPGAYGFEGPLATVLSLLDLAMIAGVLFAIALALWSLWKKPRHLEAFVALAFAGLMSGTLLLVTQHDPFTWARLGSPLLVLIALLGARRRQLLYLAPLLVMTLRTSIQLAPQVLGILRGIARG